MLLGTAVRPVPARMSRLCDVPRTLNADDDDVGVLGCGKSDDVHMERSGRSALEVGGRIPDTPSNSSTVSEPTRTCQPYWCRNDHNPQGKMQNNITFTGGQKVNFYRNTNKIRYINNTQGSRDLAKSKMHDLTDRLIL